ncbi:MAG: hypothetical protein HY904_06350 [Deltaproteobacteria bacterium]|nr:hypothetical protein [Deltaproteobacteria bacterium]
MINALLIGMAGIVLAAPPAAADPPVKPLVVVLAPVVDARARGNDTVALAGLLQSEMASAAPGAEVHLMEDAAARAGVSDVGVLRCQDISCAANAGRAVKARYVLAAQLTAVGKERVIAIRLFDAEQSRLVGMQSEKAGFEEESLPPVAARAALRLAKAAKIDKLPEPPKKAAPPPEPEPAPAPAPAAQPEPAKPAPEETPRSQTIIVVPQAPAPAAPPPQAPPPQPRLDTPPAPRGGGGGPGYQDADAVPDPNRLGAFQPTPPPQKGKRVGAGPRVGVVLATLALGGWAPFIAPPAIITGVLLLLRAIELRNTLNARPHAPDEISSMVTRGRAFEIGSYVLFGIAPLFLIYGAIMVTAGVVTAILLP